MASTLRRKPIPFGSYLLLDRINIGGMAEVWRGKMQSPSGEKRVAVKRILPSVAEDEEFIHMFIDEAKISVQLTHPNIAQIYELGHLQNSYFIAMEYIAGKDMRALFEKCQTGSRLPLPLTCYAFSKLCEGLDYAHRRKDAAGQQMNIVHRDISPQNVLIGFDGEVKLIDFGIAKAAGKASRTQAGILKGKFGYMSPEQIRGLGLDNRSDIFSAGTCLYEMLTGERLFTGESDFVVLDKVRKAEISPPSHKNPAISEALDAIVLKALAKEPSARYSFASELALGLSPFIGDLSEGDAKKQLGDFMKAAFTAEWQEENRRWEEAPPSSYADIPEPVTTPGDGTAMFQMPASEPLTQEDSIPVRAWKKLLAWRDFLRGVPPERAFYLFVAVLTLFVGIFAYQTRPIPSGFLLLDGRGVPASVKLLINGEMVPATAWPLVQRVRAGKSEVQLSADGYAPISRSVFVREEAVTPLHFEMRRVAARASLLLRVEPEDSEVRLNGEVKRPEGSAKGPFQSEIPLNVPTKITVSRSGYRTRTEQVLAKTAELPLQLKVTLEKAEQ